MPIVNNSKFYVLGVSKTQSKSISCVLGMRTRKEVLTVPMKEKVGDKMLEEIITYPDYES